MAELSDADKEVFKRATAARKANGIRLRRWSVMLDEKDLEVIDELWDDWVSRWGKRHAANHLLRAMAVEESEFQDRERADEKRQTSNGSGKI